MTSMARFTGAIPCARRTNRSGSGPVACCWAGGPTASGSWSGNLKASPNRAQPGEKLNGQSPRGHCPYREHVMCSRAPADEGSLLGRRHHVRGHPGPVPPGGQLFSIWLAQWEVHGTSTKLLPSAGVPRTRRRSTSGSKQVSPAMDYPLPTTAVASRRPRTSRSRSPSSAATWSCARSVCWTTAARRVCWRPCTARAKSHRPSSLTCPGSPAPSRPAPGCSPTGGAG